jgi:hypothetical protein
MSIESGELQLASEWPEEDKTELFANRSRLLSEAIAAQGIVPIDSIRESTARLIACMSLMQEGHISLDTQTPGLLQLTESGRRFAMGAVALQ